MAQGTKKDTSEYDRLTYEHKASMGETIGKPICVYGWSTYPAGSVLEGQPMKCFIECFEEVEDALAEYPQAQPSNRFSEPRVNLNHLPGPDDAVSGGMYPDDIDDGD